MKSILLAVLSGILLWLGWPTYGFAGFLFIAFVPLLIAVDRIRSSKKGKKGWRVMLHAYLSFVIWNFATTSWLYYATPFGMWFAVLINSLLMALVFLCYYFVARKSSRGVALLFLVSLWMSFEYLHLQWEFSWPWLNLGNGFSEYTSWVQWYEYTGTFGGTLWIWVLNICIYLLWLRFCKSKIKTTSVLFPALMILIPLGLSLYLESSYTKLITSQSKGDQVVIVQPNIDPYQEKYFQSNRKVIKLIDEIVTPVLNNSVRFIITPETVLADNLRLPSIQYHKDIQALKALLINYPNTYYLGGISLLDVFKKESTQRTNQSNTNDGITYFNDYNSAMFLESTGHVELYHKSKLVVGIENMPYKKVLEPILGNVMIDLGGTVATKTTQSNRAIFSTKQGDHIAPIICYESVYGDYITDYVSNGAHYLSIITNDAWWGNTQGHKQHLSISRLRAIENRRWIARSANTGISAIIDHTGAIKKSLGYEKRGVISGEIQPRSDLTFYTRNGDYLARIAVFIMVFVGLFSVVRRSSKKRSKYV